MAVGHGDSSSVLSINTSQNSVILAEHLIHVVENDTEKITDFSIIANCNPVSNDEQRRKHAGTEKQQQRDKRSINLEQNRTEAEGDIVKKRRRKCGSCEPCLRKANCGECNSCMNRKTSQHICKLRKCTKLKTKSSHVKDESKIFDVQYRIQATDSLTKERVDNNEITSEPVKRKLQSKYYKGNATEICMQEQRHHVIGALNQPHETDRIRTK
jgi:hypothetical protein